MSSIVKWVGLWLIQLFCNILDKISSFVKDFKGLLITSLSYILYISELNVQ